MIFLLGAVHKKRQDFLAVFDNPLLDVGILTLIYLTSTFKYLATSKFESPLPPKIFGCLLWIALYVACMMKQLVMTEKCTLHTTSLRNNMWLECGHKSGLWDHSIF